MTSPSTCILGPYLGQPIFNDMTIVQPYPGGQISPCLGQTHLKL